MFTKHNVLRQDKKFTWFLVNCSYPVSCLFGVLRRFQHCTGHITTGSWKGRGNQYIEFARFLYCKLPTNDKQLPAFPLTAMTGIEPRPRRWEARVLPLCILQVQITSRFAKLVKYSTEIGEVPLTSKAKKSSSFSLNFQFLY